MNDFVRVSTNLGKQFIWNVFFGAARLERKSFFLSLRDKISTDCFTSFAMTKKRLGAEGGNCCHNKNLTSKNAILLLNFLNLNWLDL